MPLEIFDGKTGPRLIVREPMDSTSYAEIDVLGPGASERYVLKATYQDMKANGYPALSPVTETLPERYRLYLAQERTMLENLNESLRRAAQKHVDKFGELIAHVEDAEIKWHHTPVIPRVMVGEAVIMVLPSGYSRSRIQLGIAECIRLYSN